MATIIQKIVERYDISEEDAAKLTKTRDEGGLNLVHKLEVAFKSIAKYDTDGDGTITFNELKEKLNGDEKFANAWLMKCDADGDNQISVNEMLLSNIVPYIKPIIWNVWKDKVDEFDTMDTDGELDKKEIEMLLVSMNIIGGRAAEARKMLDNDKDGNKKISVSEFEAYLDKDLKDYVTSLFNTYSDEMKELEAAAKQ